MIKTKINTKKKNQHTQLAFDVINIQLKKSYTLNQCMQEFYKVMRKHEVKQGTPNFDKDGNEIGRVCNTA